MGTRRFSDGIVKVKAQSLQRLQEKVTDPELLSGPLQGLTFVFHLFCVLLFLARIKRTFR